jgi:hypothetical protein
MVRDVDEVDMADVVDVEVRGPWQRLAQVFPFEPDDADVSDAALVARLRDAEAL